MLRTWYIIGLLTDSTLLLPSCVGLILRLLRDSETLVYYGYTVTRRGLPDSRLPVQAVRYLLQIPLQDIHQPNSVGSESHASLLRLLKTQTSANKYRLVYLGLSVQNLYIQICFSSQMLVFIYIYTYMHVCISIYLSVCLLSIRILTVYYFQWYQDA